MMKVLFLGNLYPAPWDPTRGTFNVNTVRALGEHAEMRVVAPWGWWTRLRRPGELISVPTDDSTGFAATYPTYWSAPGVTFLHGRMMAASLLPHLRRLRREFPFDVILAAFAYPDGVAAAHLSRAFGVPYVVAVLGSDINEIPKELGLRRQITSALRQAHRVVAVSRALKEKTAELGVDPSRIVVQHNGVEGDRFVPRDKALLRNRLGLAADRKIICYVGNFKPEKGVDVLVEAMAHLREMRGREQGERRKTHAHLPTPNTQHPTPNTDFELALIGSGPLREQLDRIVKENNLAELVRFHGRQPHARIPEWIGACDVFCLPSRREGCPNVVLEALASGRPVVGSAVGGVPELLDRGNGLLAPAGDPAALAKSLSEALDREWDAAALRETVPCLSWSEVGRTYREVLSSAVSERPGAKLKEAVSVER